MTYPFPIPVVPSHYTVSMTPEEEDAYYEAHAEPVPRWIRGPFALAGRYLARLQERRARLSGKMPRVSTAHSCHQH